MLIIKYMEILNCRNIPSFCTFWAKKLKSYKAEALYINILGTGIFFKTYGCS